MNVRIAESADFSAIGVLYRRVAATPGGIARLEHEIDQDYVTTFSRRAAESGLQLVGVDTDGSVVAEIHAYRPDLFCFSHVLSDLTIVVDPRSQGSGWGRAIFEYFLDLVVRSFPQVLRIELIARESNGKALAFYRSLGFEQEGVFRGRIRNLDGSFEADVPMAWCRPG